MLTMPNYWNLRYRIKYLLSGHFQRPVLEDARKRANYLVGYSPHITMLPYPILKTVLSWEGCGGFHIRANETYGWKDLLTWFPAYLSVKVFTALAGRGRRRRYFLEETNGSPALLGKRHVLLRCVKVSERTRAAVRDDAHRNDRAFTTP